MKRYPALITLIIAIVLVVLLLESWPQVTIFYNPIDIRIGVMAVSLLMVALGVVAWLGILAIPQDDNWRQPLGMALISNGLLVAAFAMMQQWVPIRTLGGVLVCLLIALPLLAVGGWLIRQPVKPH